MTLAIVVGTRPEHIKVAPLVRLLRSSMDLDVRYLWTGQHGDPAMTPSGVAPGLNWPTPEPFDGDLDATLRAVKAGAVLVQGDTLSALNGAKAAKRLGLPIIHLEAGMRSWEPDQIEEDIRIRIDRLADLMLCAAPLSAAFCMASTSHKNMIKITGQTGLDSLVEAADAEVAQMATPATRWVLVTLHRRELVDQSDKTDAVVRGIGTTLNRHDWLGVWPVHPRTADRSGGAVETWHRLGHRSCDPVSYPAIAHTLMSGRRPRFVVTDSGGLVEECYYLGIPCVIVRPATERWEALAEGRAYLVNPTMAAETQPHEMDSAIRWAEWMGWRLPGLTYGNPQDPCVVMRPTSRAADAVMEWLLQRGIER